MASTGNILEKLAFYFQYDFVIYALIVGVLVAVCASLLGVILVLKRFSLIGDGLSHVAFGATSVASILNVTLSGTAFGGLLAVTNNMIIIMPITIACAIFLLSIGRNAKVNGDAAVAMLSVGSLAIGYLLLNKFSTSTNLSGDVCTTLFGSTSILSLSIADVWMSSIMSVLVIVFFVFFYNKIFLVTFDEDFAMATGTKANRYNLTIAVITAIVIVFAMKLVGSLLISALIVFPAISAMRVFKSFKSVTICAVILSFFCAIIGILVAILWGSPVGATIVAINIVALLIFTMLGFLWPRKDRQ